MSEQGIYTGMRSPSTRTPVSEEEDAMHRAARYGSSDQEIIAVYDIATNARQQVLDMRNNAEACRKRTSPSDATDPGGHALRDH